MNKTEYEAALAKKKAQLEKQLEEHLKHNEELRALFEKHPEQKAMYIEKLLDSEPIEMAKASERQIKQLRINPAWCKKCRFAHGKPPFEDMPEKQYCMIYTHDSGETKPQDVFRNGAECEYFVEYKG